MLDLKPCPFCGKDGGYTRPKVYVPTEELEDSLKADGSKNENFVNCSYCNAFGPSSIDRVEAERLWNTRPLEVGQNTQ